MSRINVDKNIKVAETLPSDFYKSNQVFGELKEKVFYKSWQFIEHKSVLPVNSNVYPFEFMKDYIEEPLILIKDEKQKSYTFIDSSKFAQAIMDAYLTSMNEVSKKLDNQVSKETYSKQEVIEIVFEAFNSAKTIGEGQIQNSK